MDNILPKVEFKLPFEMKKKGKWFIASCSILDVHTQGETKKKAKENLIEALHLFLISCFERGTVEQVLKECGFTLAQSDRTKATKTIKAKKIDYLNIDIPFQVNQIGCRA